LGILNVPVEYVVTDGLPDVLKLFRVVLEFVVDKLVDVLADVTETVRDFVYSLDDPVEEQLAVLKRIKTTKQKRAHLAQQVKFGFSTRTNSKGFGGMDQILNQTSQHFSDVLFSLLPRVVANNHTSYYVLGGHEFVDGIDRRYFLFKCAN
jgi:hypothetical protein